MQRKINDNTISYRSTNLLTAVWEEIKTSIYCKADSASIHTVQGSFIDYTLSAFNRENKCTLCVIKKPVISFDQPCKHVGCILSEVENGFISYHPSPSYTLLIAKFAKFNPLWEFPTLQNAVYIRGSEWVPSFLYNLFYG